MLYANAFKMAGAALFVGLLVFLNTLGVFAGVGNFFVSAIAPLLSTAQDLWNFASFDFISRKEAERIMSENRRLVSENFKLNELEEENRTLRKGLAIRDEKELPLTAARILYYGQELGKEYILLERGARDGVKKENAVIDGDGFLIGFVREVYDGVSRVAFASNPGEEFEGKILPQELRTLVKGLGNRTLVLQLLPADALVQAGDLVSLFGREGVRAAYPLGKITAVRSGGSSAFKEANVLLLSRPELAKSVFIVPLKELQ